MLSASSASAHPLGNFTVNTYSGLRVQPDQVVVDFVVDMAEIPALQTRRLIDGDGDGEIGQSETARYATRACTEAAGRVWIAVGSERIPASATSSALTFPPGTGGLPTLRLTCILVVPVGDLGGPAELTFQNTNYVDRVGWREVSAVGDRTTLLSSDVAGVSRSDRLRSYPEDLLSSPPDQRGATLRARPGGPAAADVPSANLPRAVATRGVDAATRSFTALVARQSLGPLFGAVALASALALGALHALAPGHGKTIMAAYLLGQRGTMRQAAVIGLTVAATHTAGVLFLGAVLAGSTEFAPEWIFPWLGILSGLLVVAIGIGLVTRAWQRRRPLDGPRQRLLAPAATGHGHGHGVLTPEILRGDGGASHGHAVGHGHVHTPSQVNGPFHWRTLVPLGLAGGMVPSPSALVVLLGSMAVGRAWFGITLVVAYGLGMAGTLTGIGLMLATARGALERRIRGGSPDRLAQLSGKMSIVTALAITVGGLYLAGQAARQI